jgi:formylglycine-generating enzyme required for sulfatase activity
MVSIPAGETWMGCDPGSEPVCYKEDQPRHLVIVPAFQIDRYEVTVAQYKACEAAGVCPSTYEDSSDQCNGGKAGRADHPVNCTDDRHAVAYCQWAGKRLCSEVEWEKAARGSEGRTYPWGEAPATCSLAVLNNGTDGCGHGTTRIVGLLLDGASPYGVMDMAGNVGEWVADECYRNYATTPSDGSPWTGGSFRIYRGGSFR